MPVLWVFVREQSLLVNYNINYMLQEFSILVSFFSLLPVLIFPSYNCPSCLCNSICAVATKSQLLKLFTANIYTVAISEICISEQMMDGSGSNLRDPAG